MNRPMEHAAAGLKKIVTNALRRVPGKEAPLLAWPLACGRVVGERTRAMDFSDGILRVEVPDASWRTELKALAPQYVAVINRYVSESVKRIEFVITGRAAGEDARVTRA
jgi:predicted nucleic acid-binding Zn ribbon protein